MMARGLVIKLSPKKDCKQELLQTAGQTGSRRIGHRSCGASLLAISENLFRTQVDVLSFGVDGSRRILAHNQSATRNNFDPSPTPPPSY